MDTTQDEISQHLPAISPGEAVLEMPRPLSEEAVPVVRLPTWSEVETFESDETPIETLPSPELIGWMAEFADVNGVADAARKVRSLGYTRIDVFSPFAIRGMDKIIGVPRTILPSLVLIAGIFGLCGGIALAWFANVHQYKFLVSGKPLFSLPAFIPVIFETTVLCAALTAVFGMLLLNRLPRLYNPLFKIHRFRGVTTDRFFLLIEADDPQFDEIETAAELTGFGATALERVEE